MNFMLTEAQHVGDRSRERQEGEEIDKKTAQEKRNGETGD